MSETPTDEQLAEWADRNRLGRVHDGCVIGVSRDEVDTLIQEVRRLRKLKEDYEFEIRDMSIRKRRGME